MTSSAENERGGNGNGRHLQEETETSGLHGMSLEQRTSDESSKLGERDTDASGQSEVEASGCLSGDSAVTPRLDDSTPQNKSSNEQDSPEDYFAVKKPLYDSTTGFLASLPASSLSSPIQSTSASSASLQSLQASLDNADTHATAAKSLVRETQGSSGSLYSSTHSASSQQSSQANSSIRSGPRYPDQSLAALHSQTQTLPYAFMKSRCSDYGHPQPVSASPSRGIDRVQATAVSRSADQTPLGSPGLFQLHKKLESDSESGQTSPSYLHPSQLHIPKETYKLIKDFDSTTGNKIMNNYEVLEKLGVGSHGAVKRARNLVTDEEVAIKIVRRYGKKGRLGKQERPEDKVKKEVAVLKKARHPHVVSLLEVIDDPEFGKVYLVLEFVKKGEIIWRTETSKEIADFEMNRYNREVAGNVDTEFEDDMLARLNEKLRLQDLLAREASHISSTKSRQSSRHEDLNLMPSSFSDDQLALRRYATADHPDAFVPSEHGEEHDWSIESGGYEETTDDEKRRIRQLRRQRSMMDTRLTDEVLTPKATQPSQGAIPESLNLPNLSTTLIGSQYGPYDGDIMEQGTSVLNFQDILSRAASSQEHWTSEEDAFRYVPCLTMSQARDVFRDTLLGLEYLHFQGIIHRDIKPANLLWTSDYRVKISDFGVSYIGRPIREKDDAQEEDTGEVLDEEFELAKTVGTPAFYAPELCDPNLFDTEKTPVRPQITGQIDVWALGVTLYSMIFGRLPFSGDNQFQMFERIAWDDTYISSKRLKGVDENGKMPMNSNKRLPNVVEYEDVDDTLKNLISRLLQKDPTRRITLKEVKHHPWVIKDLKDPGSWIEATDPSLQSKGKKIEVSTNDVQNAVAPLNLVDRIKHGIRRLGSVVRGRDSRRRAESNAKDPSGGGGSVSSRASTVDRDGRRASLRGDEQIYSALKASRDTTDHPLSQSLVASPVAERDEIPFFVHPISHLELPSVSALGSPAINQRPTPVDRIDSTTDSIRTIRASTGTNTVRASTSPTITEDPAGHVTIDSAASSSTGLSGILGLASRRLVSSMRSRDRRHSSRENSSVSSRSSSYEQMASSIEEAHAFPSVAVSPAVAAGHVDHSLLEPPGSSYFYQPNYQSSSSRHLNESSSGAFQRAQDQNVRRQLQEIEHETTMSRPRSSTAASSAGECPPSPDDIALATRLEGQGEQRDRQGTLASVSSDDQFALSESFSSPSIPSTSTSTSHPDPLSSMLATADTITAEKYIEERRKSLGIVSSLGGSASHFDEDEAGYNGDGDGNGDGNGDGEGDYDSDDEGIVMGARC